LDDSFKCGVFFALSFLLAEILVSNVCEYSANQHEFQNQTKEEYHKTKHITPSFPFLLSCYGLSSLIEMSDTENKGFKGKSSAAGSKPAAKRERTDENAFELSDKRRVTCSLYNGKVLIDIREYYTGDSGDLAPGKKGISLSAEQWARLKAHVDDIDDAIERLQAKAAK
jgi:hypothetical protein